MEKNKILKSEVLIFNYDCGCCLGAKIVNHWSDGKVHIVETPHRFKSESEAIEAATRAVFSLKPHLEKLADEKGDKIASSAIVRKDGSLETSRDPDPSLH